jgi:hypothetical protein
LTGGCLAVEGRRGDPGAIRDEAACLFELAAGKERRDRKTEIAPDDRKEAEVVCINLLRTLNDWRDRCRWESPQPQPTQRLLHALGAGEVPQPPHG